MCARQAVPRHDVFETPLGWCAVGDRGAGICAFVLPTRDAEIAESELLGIVNGSRRNPRGFAEIRKAAERYFGGWTTTFDPFKLDLSAGTPFQQKVWSIVRGIPYGQVRTYRWIANEMGRPRAIRAVGGATGANPIPLLIPCHRVISEDGRLCGFSALGGLDLKARMLEMEGRRLFGEGHERRVMA